MSLMLHRVGLLRPSLAAPAPSVPEAFHVGDWSLAPGDEEAHVTLHALPYDGGAAISDIQYRLDDGTWASSGGTTDFTLASLTNDQRYDIELRAVNSVGAGAASDTKQVTPEADDEETFEEAVIALLGAKLRAFWLYDEPSHLWQDTSGTSAVSADTHPVGRVDDLSGNGKHLLQTTSGNKPAYRTSPSRVVYDGVNDYFSIASPAFPVDAIELFQVVEELTAHNDYRGLYSFIGAGGTDWNVAGGMVVSWGTNTAKFQFYAHAGPMNLQPAGSGAQPLALYEHSKTTSTATINENGTSIASSSGSYTGTSPHGGAFYDSARNDGGFGKHPHMARRCTIMTATLTTDERNDLRALINARYSLW
jgi:hypothetical protein